MGWSVKKENHHYFATSVGEWRVDEDLEKLLSYMKRRGLEFGVYRLSLPVDSSYDIEFFVPQVPRDSIVYLGKWSKV